MNNIHEIGEKIWNWARKLEYWVLVRWGVAIFMIATWAGPFVKAIAEDTVEQLMKNKGFTIQEFKDVQKNLEEMSASVGSMRSTVNNLNNIITTRTSEIKDIHEDQADLKKQVDRLVNFIIEKKVDLEVTPQ